MPRKSRISTKNKIYFCKSRNQYKTSFQYNGTRYEIYGNTEKECRNNLELKKLEVFTGENIELLDISLISWCKYWLNTIKNNNSIKESTFSSYKTAFDYHLANHKIANMDIMEIRVKDFQKYIDDLLKKESSKTHKLLSPKTVRNNVLPIIEAMNDAVRYEYIPTNPTSLANIPSGEKNPRQPISLEKMKELMLNCTAKTTPLKMGILIGLYTGLRRGEILALTPNDIIIKNDNKLYLKIRCEIRRDIIDQLDNKKSNKKTEVKIKSVKTANGNRDVPIPDGLHYELKKYINCLRNKYKENDMELNNNDFIIKRNINDNYYDPDTFTSDFVEYVRPLINDETIDVHTLRHTFCTRWVECGLNTALLSKIVGHHSYAYTVDQYCDVNKHYQLESENISEFYDKLGVTYKTNYSGNSFWEDTGNIIFKQGFDAIDAL